MSTLTLIIFGIIGLIFFARTDEYTRRGICWIVIAATVMFIVWFVMNPGLMVNSIVKP
jgi:hypothetical protein